MVGDDDDDKDDDRFVDWSSWSITGFSTGERRVITSTDVESERLTESDSKIRDLI